MKKRGKKVKNETYRWDLERQVGTAQTAVNQFKVDTWKKCHFNTDNPVIAHLVLKGIKRQMKRRLGDIYNPFLSSGPYADENEAVSYHISFFWNPDGWTSGTDGTIRFDYGKEIVLKNAVMWALEQALKAPAKEGE